MIFTKEETNAIIYALKRYVQFGTTKIIFSSEEYVIEECERCIEMLENLSILTNFSKDDYDMMFNALDDLIAVIKAQKGKAPEGYEDLLYKIHLHSFEMEPEDETETSRVVAIGGNVFSEEDEIYYEAPVLKETKLAARGGGVSSHDLTGEQVDRLDASLSSLPDADNPEL